MRKEAGGSLHVHVDKKFPGDWQGCRYSRMTIKLYSMERVHYLFVCPSSKVLLFQRQIQIVHHHKKNRMAFLQTCPGQQKEYLLFFIP